MIAKRFGRCFVFASDGDIRRYVVTLITNVSVEHAITPPFVKVQ